MNARAKLGLRARLGAGLALLVVALTGPRAGETPHGPDAMAPSRAEASGTVAAQPWAEGTARPSASLMTLNVRDIEVRAALQAIADFTGLNVVISDTVTGHVSLRLHRVPWEQVLELLTQARGLQARRQGNVIWVAPRAEVAARDKARLEDWLALQGLEPLQTRSIVLNYARALDVQSRLLGTGMGTGLGPVGASGSAHPAFAAALSAAYGSAGLSAPAPVSLPSSVAGALAPAAAGGGHPSTSTSALALGAGARVLSARGSVVADPRTNQLFVTDVAERLAQVAEMVARMDVPLRQVLIEARIVQANDTFGQSLGVRLGGAAQGGRFQVPDVAAASPASFVNLPAPALNAVDPAGFAVSLFNAGKSRLLHLELSALEADGKGKVVSSPRVVTADQTKAVIEQGTELPYQTAAGTGITTIAFRKANLRLEVTPQLTPEGGIVLDLDIHKDSVGQSTPAGFAIDNRHVNTQVRVDDGGTVMIGGIYETTEQADHFKVPVLGDLPLVGALFRNERRTQVKQELLVFITPKMLASSAP